MLILHAAIANLISVHVLFDPNILSLLLRIQLLDLFYASGKVILQTRTAIARAAAAGVLTRRAPAHGEASDHLWPGNFFDLSLYFWHVATNGLLRPVFALHAEKVARAREDLVENAHDAREHL